MNMATNLLGQELRTNSGTIGVVVLVMATPTKIEVVLCEAGTGIFAIALLQNCRLLK